MTENILVPGSNEEKDASVIEMSKDENKEISIKFSERSFAKMLVDLLSKKQTLSGIDKNAFRLKLEDLCQFNYLLRAKIDKEQHTTLNLFSVTVQYNDHTKRTLNSIESLESFLETRNVYPTSLTMEWDILLKFPNAENVENQKVEISFIVLPDDLNGQIKLNIEHTNQAWAIEVLNLFKSKITEISYKQNKTIEFVNSIYLFGKHSKDKSNYIPYFPLLLLLLFIMFFVPTRGDLSKQQIRVNNEFYQNILNISEKIESIEANKLYLQSNLMFYIIKNDKKEYVQSLKGLSPELKKTFDKYIDNYSKVEGPFSFGNFWKYPLYLIIIFGIIQFYFSKLIAHYEEGSFILITNESNRMYEKFIGNKGGYKFQSITALVFTIVVGLSINMIYSSAWFKKLIEILS